jgi:hypothetical protein
MNRSPLSAEDMDPMFEALSAPEMHLLQGILESGYSTLRDTGASRAMLRDHSVLCSMLATAEYMKFGL